jgi:glyoxylase-like metal-dependent hydrolase (beta-lactamase superfamily II)
MRHPTPELPRRRFIGDCAKHLALMSVAGLPTARALFARPNGPIRAREPWGRVESVGERLWAMISTPLDGDRTTLCNGGIIAGRNAVVAVEGFGTPAGAKWLAEQARTLAGRWPTHVVLTHYHGDHTAGIAGYRAAGANPALRSTAATRDLVREQDARRPDDAAAIARVPVLADVVVLPPEQTTTIDLGGRSIRVVPRTGHTRSDVSIEVDDAPVVWCGDLVWNGMFPNYVDAIPSQLSASVRALSATPASTFVPGHGPLANVADMARYTSVIDHVEAAARRAIAAGTPVADAARDYRLPASLGEWTMFSPRYFEVAFSAWERELKPR